MRRRRKTKLKPKHWLLLAAVLAALLLLIIGIVDLSSSTSFWRDPVYLPHGDVVFVPLD